MAQYQVLYWKHIPSQVMAWEGEARSKQMLPDYFQAAIDAYAMKDGSTEMDAYLEGWRRGPVEERAAEANEVGPARFDPAVPRADGGADAPTAPPVDRA